MNNPKMTTRNAVLGVLLILVIIFCSFFIFHNFGNRFYSQNQSASVISSQNKGLKGENLDKIKSKQLYSAIRFLNNQIEKIVSDEQQDSSLIGKQVSLDEFISQRKNLMARLLKVDLHLFLASILPVEMRNRIPKELQNDVESEVIVSGELEVLSRISGGLNNREGGREYNLLVSKDRMPLYLTQDMNMTSGNKVKVVGISLGGAIVANKDQVSVLSTVPVVVARNNSNNMLAQIVSSQAPVVLVEDKNVLVLLLNYEENISNPPISSEQARDIIFNGRINDFYEEQSYGRVQYSGDVRGWYTLPGVCDLQHLDAGGALWNQDIVNVLGQNNIDLNQYTQIVIVNNCDIENDAVTVGLASVGNTIINDHLNQYYRRPVSWIDISRPSFEPYIVHPFEFTDLDFILSELLGFNLGLEFANGLDCNESTLPNDGFNCNLILFGNAFDKMGLGINSLHFNAFYKEMLGWVPSTSNSLAISRPGRYTINTLEGGLGEQSKKFAKIKVMGSEKTPFYLEFRKGVGFDAKLNSEDLVTNQNGLMVNYVTRRSGSNLAQSRLLDMSPTQLAWLDDTKQATLNVGRQFLDPESGVTIGPVISAATSSITFDVNFQPPVCIRNNPLLELPFVFPESSQPGNLVHIYTYYDNGDSVYCPSSPIRLGATSNFNWPINIPLPNPITAVPNDYGEPGIRKDITFTVPVDAPLGIYATSLNVRNMTTGLENSQTVNIYVETRPIISNITPDSGPVGSVVELTGTGFSIAPYIHIRGQSGFGFIDGVSDGSHTNFEIPSLLTEYECSNMDCLTPTSPGDYVVTVYNSRWLPGQNDVSFVVTQ